MTNTTKQIDILNDDIFEIEEKLGNTIILTNQHYRIIERIKQLEYELECATYEHEEFLSEGFTQDDLDEIIQKTETQIIQLRQFLISPRKN